MSSEGVRPDSTSHDDAENANFQDLHDEALAAYSEALGQLGLEAPIPEPPLPPTWRKRFRENAEELRRWMVALWDSGAETPARIGPYVIEEELARGGMGVVYAAVDTVLERRVALKVPVPGRSTPRDIDRFDEEIRAAAKLNHPGIVPVLASGQDAEGRPYYVMRRIEGKTTLKEAIAEFHAADRDRHRDPGERSLALRMLLRPLISACRAVAYAHSEGVVHRDLKPANIMLGRFGETIVVDWGLVKRLATPDNPEESAEESRTEACGQARTGPGVGTPEYMSPEQAAGHVELLSPATDLFGLGATLYCILTNRSPFADLGLVETLERAREGRFPPPRAVAANVPPALEAICLKAMAHHPADRFDTVDELANELERWLADQPLSPTIYREPLLPRAGRFLRRHRVLAASTLVATLLSLIAVSAFSVHQIRVERRLQAAADRLRLEREQTAAQRDNANYWLRRVVKTNRDTIVAFQNHPRLQNREMNDLRYDLLKLPRGELQQLSGDAVLLSADPAMIVLLAQARLDFGTIYLTQGKLDEARDEYDAAVRLARKALVDSPGDTEALGALAFNIYRWGRSLFAANDLDGAVASLQESIALWESLCASEQATANHQHGLAETLAALAMIQRDRGDLIAARAALDRAIPILHELARAAPTEPISRHILAGSLLILGGINLSEGRTGDAETQIHRAEEIWSRLSEDHPKQREFPRWLANARSERGKVQHARGDFEGAVHWLTIASQSQRELIAQHPTAAMIRGDLAQTRLQLAKTQRARSNTAQAIQECREAITLWEALRHDNAQTSFVLPPLARSYALLSRLQIHQHELPDAESSSITAIRLATDACRVKPDTAEVLCALAEARNARGRWLLVCGDADASVSLLTLAVEDERNAMKRAPGDTHHRADLADHLLALTDALFAAERTQEAAPLLRERLQLASRAADPEALFLVARDLARNAGAAPDRNARWPDPRDILNDQILAVLRLASDAGWREPSRLRGAEFSVLEQHSDYRRWKHDLWDRVFPVNPFAP